MTKRKIKIKPLPMPPSSPTPSGSWVLRLGSGVRQLGGEERLKADDCSCRFIVRRQAEEWGQRNKTLLCHPLGSRAQRGTITNLPTHEPKRAAGILPAVLEPVCRRVVGSTLTSRFMAPTHVKTLEVFPFHEPVDLWRRLAICRVAGWQPADRHDPFPHAPITNRRNSRLPVGTTRQPRFIGAMRAQSSGRSLLRHGARESPGYMAVPICTLAP